MGKKLWNSTRNAILQQILEYLQINSEGVDISVEPYKSEMFKIFKQAYKDGFCGTTNRPEIIGDSIWVNAREAVWVHSEKQTHEKKYKDIQLIRTWWDEWTYAWNRPKPRRTYKRKKKTD